MEITFTPAVVPPVRYGWVVLVDGPNGRVEGTDTFCDDKSYGVYGTMTAHDAATDMADFWECVMPGDVSVATVYRAHNNIISELFGGVGTAE